MLSLFTEIDTRELSDDGTFYYISFIMWIYQDKEIKKATKCLKQKEFHKDWEQMTIELKEHIQRKEIQVAVFKADLKQGEAILDVDYSKSYRNKQQDEIPSTYFGKSILSLFIVFVYHLDNSESLIQ